MELTRNEIKYSCGGLAGQKDAIREGRRRDVGTINGVEEKIGKKKGPQKRLKAGEERDGRGDGVEGKKWKDAIQCPRNYSFEFEYRQGNNSERMDGWARR